jgi:tRNA nucleotidyltransferase (CCA-adding enzyme)
LHVRPDEVRDLFRLRFAICRGEQADSRDLLQRWRHAHRVLLSHPVIDAAGLVIGGSELKGLGLPPGPEYSRILAGLVQRVIDDPTLNDRERLMQIVKEETGL